MPAERTVRWLRLTLPAATFTLTFIARVWHINRHFAMLEDQIRDWGIALGSFTSLPLVGPPTHFGGYTIGPAPYWILWSIRVVIGPWFENLPHGGGIGQALLQSGADALLLTAVWKRTGSVWLALTAVVLVTTASFDLALAAVIWTPVVGSTLAKTATALILLNWHRGSLVRSGVTAAIAWSAVQAYTGTVFVALGIFAALVVEECVRRDWRAAWQRGLVIAGVVGALQVPYVIHQVAQGFSHPAMGAVTYSITSIMRGHDHLRLTASAAAYAHAVSYIQFGPWSLNAAGWLVLGCGVLLAVRYRHDPVLLAVTLLPQLAAVAGYALFLGDLDTYYYLSLMPAAVLTILLGATAFVHQHVAHVVGMALLVGAIAVVPARLRFAARLPRLPEYGVLVAASRQIVRLKQPMRSIRPEFALPPTTDPEFIFRILGGRIDRRAEWRAVIAPDGRVTYFR
jgi:hypothetical protein